MTAVLTAATSAGSGRWRSPSLRPRRSTGQLRYYVGKGEFTADPIPPEFFGCAGVAEISDLQRKINRLGYAGYRHHVGVSPGTWERAVREAFNRYLGYTETEL